MNLEDIKGVGVKTLGHLVSENINTVDDLLYLFPKSYIIYEINNDLLFSCQYTSVEAIICTRPIFIKYRRNVNSIIFYAMINNYKVKCIIFSGDYLRYKLLMNTKVILYGKYKLENKEFIVQSVFFDSFNIKIEVLYKKKLLNDKVVSKIIKNIFNTGYTVEDTLPKNLVDKYKLYPIMKYLYASHFPENKADYVQILRRRKYEEFFWYSLSLEHLRSFKEQSNKTKRIIDVELIQNFIKSLPYSLSKDQRSAINDIYKDMSSNVQMNRLLQGDVGCGKSIVAYISSLMAISASYPVVIMVPTEILAKQTYDNACKYFSKMNIICELLTSSVKNKDKMDIIYRLMSNRVNIIIGTHALLEENVKFFKLGLVIIDEQHRFGVNQRKKLLQKYKDVDALYLTATPIPRTLGLTSFGDLDISSIHSMPEGRIPITTEIIDYYELERNKGSFLDSINKGEQIYVVVPLVNENEDIDAIDIDRAYEYFSNLLENVEIGIIHGKLKSQQKNSIMQDFKNNKISVLISTTVIEVGVDNPNATIMIVLDADRFGLAQIHQLRGRVGRGDKKSICYLVSNKTDNQRLMALKKYSSGFDVAVEDFKQRGPGDYFGDLQSGFVNLTYADFESDYKIWNIAKEDGKEYYHIFKNENSNNKKFLEIINDIQNQKNKIN